jgi:hypothetical protein
MLSNRASKVSETEQKRTNRRALLRTDSHQSMIDLEAYAAE